MDGSGSGRSGVQHQQVGDCRQHGLVIACRDVFQQVNLCDVSLLPADVCAGAALGGGGGALSCQSTFARVPYSRQGHLRRAYMVDPISPSPPLYLTRYHIPYPFA